MSLILLVFVIAIPCAYVSAAIPRGPLYYAAPCEYMRILHPGTTVVDISVCQTQILQDLSNNQHFFQIVQPAVPGPPPAVPAPLPTPAIWTSLITQFLYPDLVRGPQCTASDLGSIPNPVDRNIGEIDTDASAAVFNANAVAVQNLVKCYHFRNTAKLYVSGYVQFLQPLFLFCLFASATK